MTYVIIRTKARGVVDRLLEAFQVLHGPSVVLIGRLVEEDTLDAEAWVGFLHSGPCSVGSHVLENLLDVSLGVRRSNVSEHAHVSMGSQLRDGGGVVSIRDCWAPWAIVRINDDGEIHFRVFGNSEEV